MNQIYFSIVIPTLNEEIALPHLLKDLEQQQFKQFEVIVVDGNSQDKTLKKVAAFEHRLPQILVVKSQMRGASLQRNLGGKQAQGEFIIFMDADNRLDDGFLDSLWHNLQNKQSDLFTCWCLPDSNAWFEHAAAQVVNLFISTATLVGFPCGLGACIGCRRTSFQYSTGFNPSISFAEEYEFVNRLHRSGNVMTVFKHPKFVYSFRRFRNIGKLRLLMTYGKLFLKRIINKPVMPQEYPMGGQTHTSTKK